MKMWLLKHKMLLYFFAIFGAILVITDMLSWIGFLFQNLYKILVDDRKVSLLGDITGGVIGGGGTMLAVILSIHKTDEVQLEHQQEIRTQQKRQEISMIKTKRWKCLQGQLGYNQPGQQTFSWPCRRRKILRKETKQATNNRIFEV